MACTGCSGTGRATQTTPVVVDGQLAGSKTESVTCGSCGGSGLR